jgi:uncharacterized integral membrane protein (TIGR00697 family)
MNSLIFLFHILSVSLLSLFFLRRGKNAMMMWAALLLLTCNLFVIKQITLFGLSVTCSDALAVGYLFTLNLIQEFFGKQSARQTLWLSFGISVSFILLSYLHLAYEPNAFDQTQIHFATLLKPVPRIMIASFASFLLVQLFDLRFFNYLRGKTVGKYLTLRMALSLTTVEIMDTFLFSFLGLYGIVGSLFDVIVFSFLIKLLCALMIAPFSSFARKTIRLAE